MYDAQISRSALAIWIDGADSVSVSARDVEKISLRNYVSTIENMAVEQSCPSLGWILGETVSLPHFGEIGAVVKKSATLGCALRRMCDYFELLQDLTELHVTDDGEYANISYRILDPDIWPRHQDAIFTLAIKAQILRSLPGFPWQQAEIFLETRDAKAASDLTRVSGIKCYTGHETNMIRFPRQFLHLAMTTDCASPDHLPGLRNILIAKRRTDPIEERVRTLIYRNLGTGTIDQADIARQLGQSSRTLRRHLARLGLSFQEIVDDCRMRQAVREFQSGGPVSITQTALRLGYSEHSTFSRAFTRWSGMAPLTYMRKHGTQGMRTSH